MIFLYLCGMTDERLSRHLQQENADLKSENSRLRMQTDTQETKLQEKDSEVLRLLNQIATDMIRKSDVDRLVEEAVAKATAALKADYEERMKAMAAEYETKIAELQNQKDGKGDDKDETPGKSTKNSKKKGGTEERRYCYLQFHGGGYAAHSGRDEQGCGYAGSSFRWRQ